MVDKQNDYGVKSFNITDSVGQFTYKVRLSNHIDFDPGTGFLYCKDAIVGNVGVQTYKGYELGFADGNRIVKVHRIEDHIFAKESMESLRGKPITLEHPTEMVDSNNVKKYGMGTVLDVRREDDNITADLVIQDKALIDKVAPEDENGERHISNDFRDLSLGYSAKLLPYQDTNEYVQTNIEYNHLAVVREGRAANAVIRDNQNEDLKGVKTMGLKERIKGLFFKKNPDNTVVVQDEESKEEQVVSVEEFHETRTFQDPMEHDKVIKVEVEHKETVKEQDGPDAKIEPEKEKEKEEEGEKKPMKDRAYFDSAMKEAMALPEGAYKDGRIQEINDEYATAFPKKVLDTKTVVKDSVLNEIKPVKSEDIDKAFKDEEPKKVDFDFMERESKEFYDKISNPESGAFKDHKEWKDNYNQVVRSGRTNLNI